MLEVALVRVAPAEGAVRASLAGAGDATLDHAIGDTWSMLRADLGSGECAELTITGDPRAEVAIARPIVRRPGARRPWVILYVFDTLRFDQLVAASGELRPIPAFEALAADGLLFVRAYSNSSWTRPSVASLLTGVGPSVHGVYDLSDRIRTEVPSLATVLADAGYRTVAISTNPNVLPTWNFDAGFDQFVDLIAEGGQRRLYRSLETVGRTVVTEATDEPLFLLIHDNGPHAPYWTPVEYEAPLPPLPHPETRTTRRPRAWQRYGRAVQYSSARLEALIGLLRSIDRYEDAVIAVLGDHGESFGEDGFGNHATALSGVQIHVPVILKAPRTRGLTGRVSAPVSLADVAPTVLALLGLPRPDAWTGRGLPLDPATAPDSPADIVSELDTPLGRSEALIRWPWKYVRRGAVESLFDLARDPGETESVAHRHSTVLADLRAALASIRRPVAGEVVFECVAGARDARVDATLFLGAHDPPVEIESNDLESFDRVDRPGATLRLSLDLPHRAERRGRGAFGADTDRVRLTGVTRERVRVRLEREGGAADLVGPAGEPLPADATTIELADVTIAVRAGRLGRTRNPRCRLYRTAEPARESGEPIPPDVERRLRALGYL